MTFTYDPSAWPGGVPPAVEHVRMLLGDTVTRKNYLEDEEIQVFLTAHNDNPTHAAYSACDVLLAKLAKEADADGAGIRSSRSQRFSQVKDLQLRLRKAVASNVQVLYVGGSKTQINADKADSDWRGNAATRLTF